MNVYFLGKTAIAMQPLLSVLVERFQMRPKIDDLRMSQDHSLAYLVTLSDIKGLGCDFSNLGPLLRHEHQTYAVYCKDREMYEIAMESRLSITTTTDNELGIVSGTLEEWRTVVINGSSESSLSSFRLFANLIQGDMERRDLSQLFCNYGKVLLRDGTFKLLEKK